MADLGDQNVETVVCIDQFEDVDEDLGFLSEGSNDEDSDNELLGLGNCENNSAVVKLIDRSDVSTGLSTKQMCQKFENKVDLGFYTKV